MIQIRYFKSLLNNSVGVISNHTAAASFSASFCISQLLRKNMGLLPLQGFETICVVK